MHISAQLFSLSFCMVLYVGSIIVLRFKLQMLGIPFHSPADTICDNQGVVNNSSKLESKLNKKHSSVAYYATIWAVTTRIIRVGKIPEEENLADALTKNLSVEKCDCLCGNWTY